MGHVHRYSGEVLRVLEWPSKNTLVIWGKGGIFWVVAEELDVCAVKPVQHAAYTENVPAFR